MGNGWLDAGMIGCLDDYTARIGQACSERIGRGSCVNSSFNILMSYCHSRTVSRMLALFGLYVNLPMLID